VNRDENGPAPDAAKQSKDKAAPLPEENATLPAPVKVLPDAATLFDALLQSWKRVQLGSGRKWNPPLDPTKSNLLAKGHKPLAKAQDLMDTLSGREGLVNLRGAGGIVRELSDDAIRLLDQAERDWQRAFRRGKTDPHGRLSAGPTGAVLDYARWQRRAQDATDLAAGHFNPDASLTPPGPEPSRFNEPLAAASAVFEALAMIQALADVVKAFPCLDCSPYPDAMAGILDAAESRARADLKLVQGILSSLRDCREWTALLDFNPDAVEADTREVNRLFWGASERAKRYALESPGTRLHALDGTAASLALGKPDQRGTWIRSSLCWWEAISAREREHLWQHECKHLERIQAEIDACVDDPDQPTPARRDALDRRLFLEKQLRLTGKRMEDLADKMQGNGYPNTEVRNGTDD